ncbi:putative bifunctional diguanylate cyclase/phosphodiesterase [Salimicrobium halophilum]|uniref:Diguanylate cyclase (GGDEF) domain-containing protein n=1 Tax=Salimicrobium halophilum TaxID=86666 RepID=A0A1G8VSL8_9BACI|nr:GGDEF domain-containing phosphodiesterase [Salimicrobium halophilum]SDJ68959.1 diguanylate cyclase (GGDEF) domain-containing protein [Salimicrobium halophilum]
MAWRLLKQLVVPTWFYDRKSDRIYINQTYREHSALRKEVYTLEEFIGEIPHQYREQFHSLREREDTSFSFNYQFYDSEDQSFEDIVSTFYSDQGEVDGYSGHSLSFMEAVTEAERLKQAIVEIGESFRKNGGRRFYDFAVRYLADLLEADAVIIGTLSGEDKMCVDAVAMVHKGEVINGMKYELEGTPCEEVTKAKECFVPANAKQMYPEDEAMQSMDIESYFGTPLYNSRNEVIGLLAVMSESAKVEGELERAVFRVFADRISTELTKQSAELELQAVSRYDHLTGLVNREYFGDLIDMEMDRSSSRVVLVVIDIDNFKMVNDSWGHDVGDELLQKLAKHLLEEFAELDCVLSRMSSDEFGVMIHGDWNEGEIVRHMEQLFDSMRFPFVIGGREYFATLSVGIAFSEGVKAGKNLISQADAAMNKAKFNGRNRYEIYHRHLGMALKEELQIKQALYHALDQDELVLFYQPQVCTENSVVKGYEALLRWDQPKFGLLTPDRFIELAEESGFIIPMGEWVMQEACRQLKEWQEEHGRKDLKVSVNLSARQFKDKYLEDKVLGAIHKAGITPGHLVLEITESMILDDFDHSVNVLNALRAKGVEIHLDDFGTGYSSLSYLSKLPVDTLKIDRSFIWNIGKTERDGAIVRAIIAMAENLGMKIIAEGVETKNQVEYLKSSGCPLYQGFYYSKPAPPKSLGIL